jgi:VCBS repeat-containing protein
MMSAVLVTTTTHGHLELHDDGTYVYQPQRGFRGVDRFTYQARNAVDELSSIATVTITVR